MGERSGWTVLIAVSAAVLFGPAPGLRMSGGNLQEVLKDGGHGTSDGKKHDRLRSTLVVAEIALACVLLVGAGLLLRSFLRVLDVDLGFEPSRAAAISVDYAMIANAAKRTAIWQEVVSRSSMIPGVEAAGISDNLPMSRNRSWGIAARGEQKRNAPDFVPVFVYIVSPGYLKAMGMRLLEGRDISWEDLANNRNVVIINETVARKIVAGTEPHWPYSDCRRHGCRGDRRDCRCSRKQCRRKCRSADVPAERQSSLGRKARTWWCVRSCLPARWQRRDDNAAADQSRTTGDRIQTDSDAGGSRDVAKALLCAAGWDLCRSRDSSGFTGNLRRYLILRYAADTRRSAYAWRWERRKASVQLGVIGKTHATGADWHHSWNRCVDGGGASDCFVCCFELRQLIRLHLPGW